MNECRKYFKEKNYNIIKYKKVGKVDIVYTNHGNYCFKEKGVHDYNKIIKYLKAKKFYNALDLVDEYNDRYDVTNYIDEVSYLEEDKIVEAIYLISMLHNRTTFFKNISLDEIKTIYENSIDKINNIYNYYDNLCSSVDDDLFISPSRYLFTRNITLIYKSLDSSRLCIEKWYEIMKEKRIRRVTMTHNNLSLSHILMGDNSYLISWDKASFNSPVMDLFSLFKENFSKIDLHSLLEIYNTKYQLMKEEYYLLFSLLLIPDTLSFDKEEIENTRNFYLLFKYINMVLNTFLNDYLNNKK